MKKMIGTLALIAAVALVSCTAVAEGNRLLEAGMFESFAQLLWNGETLYAPSQNRMYTWQPGDEALTAWEDGMAIAESLLGQDSAEGMSFARYTLFLDNGSLRGLRLLYDDLGGLEGLAVCDICLEEGMVRTANAVAVNAPRELLGRDFYFTDVCGRDGTLFLLGEDENGALLCCVDMAASDKAHVEEVGGWGNGRLLSTAQGLLMAKENYDAECLTLSWVQEDGRLKPAFDLPMLNIYSLATSEKGNVIYAMDKGKVCPVNLDDGELGAPVSALPVTPDSSSATDGNRFYAANLGSRVAILDVTSPLPEDSVLTMRGLDWSEGFREAMLQFIVEHPEQAVAVNDADVGQEVLEELLTQSSEPDIYIINNSYNASYDALLESGYMLPLDGSEVICGLIGSCRFPKNCGQC